MTEPADRELSKAQVRKLRECLANPLHRARTKDGRDNKTVRFLMHAGLVIAESDPGAWGGCQLTEKGEAVAKKIRDVLGPL